MSGVWFNNNVTFYLFVILVSIYYKHVNVEIALFLENVHIS